MRQLRRVLLLTGVLPALLAACGEAAPPAHSSPSPMPEATLAATATQTPPAATTATPPAPPAVTTGIAGVATIGPRCPVERIGSPCPDSAFEGTIVVRDAGGAEIARTTSDAQGRFSVALPPGRYVVVTLVASILPAPARAEVTVIAGQVTSVALRLDSGIR